jgi:hypothetical protein
MLTKKKQQETVSRVYQGQPREPGNAVFLFLRKHADFYH